MVTNRWFIPFVTIAVVVLIAMKGFGLAVSPRTEARGSFTTTSTTIHGVTEDKFNETIEFNSVITYTGTLEGTSTLQGTLTIRRDDRTSFQGVETFTGLVNGTPGTLTFNLVGSGDPYQTIQLTSTITSGTGDLASLRGSIFLRAADLEGTYTGQIDYE